MEWGAAVIDEREREIESFSISDTGGPCKKKRRDFLYVEIEEEFLPPLS